MTIERMKLRNAAVVSLFLSMPTSAHAEDAKPLDLATVDPAMVEGFFGKWRVGDAGGDKTCDVVLKKDAVIGGMLIEVDPKCATVFPVMGNVAAWRLYENWEVGFADATRKELIRFTAPDETYVATPEVDGIVAFDRIE